MKTFLISCLIVLTLCVAATLQCPSNQHRVTCGTACPITCKNRNNPPQFCTLQCYIGCACNDGYVKLKNNSGPCVKPSECPDN
ncbi:TIL domain-containing protein [Trichonephila clavata]|uniref:TIL domain-containing protein n=1 Tax=Trichonephila clavata TaxID=2740835 RepID=A0A8X6LLA6_TRICU|nr:TIL domain-containing protein [Trichonephila clavata]